VKNSMMAEFDLFLPMYREYYFALSRKATSQELVKEILHMVDVSSQEDFEYNKISAMRSTPNLYELEYFLNYKLRDVFEEIEQLFQLSPKKNHKSLTQKLHEIADSTQNEFAPEELFKTIKFHNYHSVSWFPDPAGEMRPSETKISPCEKIEVLELNSNEFERMLDFFNYYLNKLVLVLDRKYESITRGSYHQPVQFNDLVLQPKMFMDICSRLCNEVEWINEKVVCLLHKEQNNKFVWSGVGNKTGIPVLAALLDYLEENKITKAVSSKRDVEFVYNYFSIPIEGRNYKYLLECLSKVNQEYKKFFVLLLK
jgi:hypothetical protein